MSDDLKWDPKKKQQRDEDREKRDSRDKITYDVSRQKTAFLNKYQAWKNRLARRKDPKPTLEMISDLNDLKRDLDQIVTHPAARTWKLMTETLLNEKIGLMQELLEPRELGSADAPESPGAAGPADATSSAPADSTHPDGNPGKTKPGPGKSEPSDPSRN